MGTLACLSYVPSFDHKSSGAMPNDSPFYLCPSPQLGTEGKVNSMGIRNLCFAQFGHVENVPHGREPTCSTVPTDYRRYSTVLASAACAASARISSMRGHSTSTSSLKISPISTSVTCPFKCGCFFTNRPKLNPS